MTDETLFEAAAAGEAPLDAFLIRRWLELSPETLRVDALPIPPDGCVMLTNVGRVGDDPLIPRLLADARRLVLFRELGPFLSASRLALLVPRDAAETDAHLERIGTLFRGNLDFLTMARRLVELTRENAALNSVRDELRQTQAELAALRNSRVLRFVRAVRTRLFGRV